MKASKKNKKYKAKNGILQNLKNDLQFVCSMGVYVFLFFLVAVYALYAPEGYIQLATHKYQFLKKLCIITAAVMTPFIALYYLMLPKEEKKQIRISYTDVFVLLYLVLNIISFLCTKYREEALWGTSGWYMGFMMQLLFVGIYFFLSRFYDGRIDVLPFFMGASLVVFLWALLNRFSIYPIDMQIDHEAFISSLGNINWFCGFWAVFFVVSVALYLITENLWMRIWTGICSVVGLGLAAVEGSDSAFLSLGIVFFFLFFIAFQKTEYMKRLLEEAIFYCTSCQVMRIIVMLDRDRLTGDTAMAKLMLGNLTLIVLVILGVLRFFLEKKDRAYKQRIKLNTNQKSSKKVAEEKEMIWEWKWLQHVTVGLTVAVVAIYLLLLILNTRAPGSIGFLSKYSLFLFNGSWGSSRGATWLAGIKIYQSFSFKERLFGAGQDCFAIYAYNVPELSAGLQEQWPTSRLTNAHNECITHLVNVGIFGMLCFCGIFWSSFKRLLNKAKEEPLCYIFAASLLSYFIHNQFSFSQVLNTPYIYMMLGLGENLMRRCNEK